MTIPLRGRKTTLILALAFTLAGCAGISQSPTESGSQKPVKSARQAGNAPGASADSAAPGAADNQDATDAAAIRHEDLWARIRAGLNKPGLGPLDSPLIARHEHWFAANPEYIERMVVRARLYLHYIVEEVEKRGMPMEIALLPAIESAYQPHAYSRARAVGLWQFIPSTGRLYGLRMNWWYDGRRDVMASTQAALDYLEKLRDDFNGDWQLALAAYNCGEGKVARLVELNRRKNLPTNYASLSRLPRETKNYVPKLMAMINIIKDPAKYGITLASIPDNEYFAAVETDAQIDLSVVAKLTDTPVDDLYYINPGYSRWITDPNGPHTLLVPADKKEQFLAGIASLPDNERVVWQRHEVRKGDTIGQVARHYNVTVDAIRVANQMNSNTLRIGQDLLIPVSASQSAAALAPRPPAMPRLIERSASTGSGNRIIHRVRSGESLWSIARRYGVYVHQLREWNLLDGNSLRMGQRLIIWRRGGSAALGQPASGRS